MTTWLQNKLKSDYFKVYFFDMIAKLFTVIISILIIRCLTEDDYAQYTLFGSIGSFISGVLGSGIGLAYTRYAVILRQKKAGMDAILYKSLRKRMVYTVLLLFIITIFILLLTSNFTFIFTLGVVYGLTLALYQLNVVFFQARERYSVGGIISNIKNIAVAIAIYIVFLVPGKIRVFPVLIIYSSAILVSWIITTCYINFLLINEKIEFDKRTNYLGIMFQESVWIILYMFMLSAFNQLDVLILNYTRPASDVAHYGVAYKYYANVLSLLPALQVVLRVKNSSLEMVENPKYRNMSVIAWIKKSTPFAILLLIVGCITAQFAFPFLNGHVYDSAILTFNILLIGACLSYVTAPNVSVMLAAKKHKLLFLLSIGSFLINFIGNIIFIPKFGANAAAITTVMAHFFLNGGSTFILLISDKNTEVQI